MVYERKRRGFRAVRWLAFCLAALIVLAAPWPQAAAGQTGQAAPQVAALFVNVGKADSALIFCGGNTYLIDTGSKGSTDALLRALDTYAVMHLDGIFVTHTDKDHVGGLKKLLQSGVSVAQLYAPKLHSEKSEEEHPVWEEAQKHDLPMTWLLAGDVLTVDEGCSFTVLGPISRDVENENNNSLVLYLQTPEGSMLFTGDMQQQEEAELLDAGVVPKADVLKVSHHGKKNSTGDVFVYRVKPQVAVISTNSQEEKDTPAAKVMKLLWEVQAGVYVTQDATCGIFVSLSGGTARAEAVQYKE